VVNAIVNGHRENRKGVMGDVRVLETRFFACQLMSAVRQHIVDRPTSLDEVRISEALAGG